METDVLDISMISRILHQPKHADKTPRPKCSCGQNHGTWKAHSTACAIWVEVATRLKLGLGGIRPLNGYADAS